MPFQRQTLDLLIRDAERAGDQRLFCKPDNFVAVQDEEIVSSLVQFFRLNPPII